MKRKRIASVVVVLAMLVCLVTFANSRGELVYYTATNESAQEEEINELLEDPVPLSYGIDNEYLLEQEKIELAKEARHAEEEARQAAYEERKTKALAAGASVAEAEEIACLDSDIANNAVLNPESGQHYEYCPSVMYQGGVENVFFCRNKNDGQIIDYIYLRRNGGVTLQVLAPTSGAWDSVHVCDPSVIQGYFNYSGTVYRYMMAYLGCSTYNSQQNQIGVAVSNDLLHWVKYEGNPVVHHGYQSAYSSYFQWGVGQPSIVSVDHAGKVLMFYTKGTYNKTASYVRLCDFSNMNSPVISDEVYLSSSGTGDFLSNGDFAYTDGTLYMVCDHHPFAGGSLDYIANESAIYAASWTLSDQVSSLSNISWSRVGAINSSISGWERNHNCCFFRDPYGALAANMIYYTHASSSGGGLWTYRIQGYIF